MTQDADADSVRFPAYRRVPIREAGQQGPGGRSPGKICPKIERFLIRG